MKHVHPWPQLEKSGDSFEVTSTKDEIMASYLKYRETTGDYFDIELIPRSASIKVGRR